MPFYSLQVYFLYFAELAKHLQSGGFYAGNAALGSNEPHNGNWMWLRALRRECARFVLLLDPYLPSLMPGRWLCGLWARWVGGALVKVAVSLPVLCVHVRRETLPSTHLGVAYALLKGGAKETNPGFPYLTKKRQGDKGRLYQR